MESTQDETKRNAMCIVLDKLESHCPGFWKDNWIFISIFLTALMCDCISTTHFMIKYGVQYEMHPVVRLVSEMLGPYKGPMLTFFGKAFSGVVVGLYLRKWAPFFFVTVSIISFWAAWYNIWGIMNV